MASAYSPSPALVDALERARRLGVLGPGPVGPHVEHATAFVAALEPVSAGEVVVDLGSGGGVPGLVVADARPDLRVVLLDAMEKRTALLVDAVAAMGATGQVQVVTGRAELVGRDPELRGSAAAVTARSFGPPATTAECAAPLLRLGGRLLVSEPPEDLDRWPGEGLEELGMVPSASLVQGVKVLVQERPCPDRFPRRNGLPAKRPLF